MITLEPGEEDSPSSTKMIIPRIVPCILKIILKNRNELKKIGNQLKFKHGIIKK